MDDLPTVFENHSIEYLDDQQLIDCYRKLNRPFVVLKIAPIRNQGTVLKVVILLVQLQGASFRVCVF